MEFSKALDVRSLAKKIFGSVNDRRLKSYRPKVAAINAMEAELEALSDEQLRARTEDFKAQLAAGKTLDDILVPAFATVREAAKRTLGQRHFDVQLIGGMVLHEGAIAEMRTGEGKTLVATLPVYLNALAGKGVHVVTVNDYLARRDAEWMGQVYRFLGLSVRSRRSSRRRACRPACRILLRRPCGTAGCDPICRPVLLEHLTHLALADVEDLDPQLVIGLRVEDQVLQPAPAAFHLQEVRVVHDRIELLG